MKVKKTPSILMGNNLITDYMVYDGDEFTTLCDSDCVNKLCRRNKANSHYKQIKNAEGVVFKNLTLLCISSKRGNHGEELR